MSSSPSIGSTSVSSRVRSVALCRFHVESAAVNRKLFIEMAWALPALSSLPLLNSSSALWFASTSSFCSSVTTTGSAKALTIHQSHSFSTAWASPPRRSSATLRAWARRLPACVANGTRACTSASLAGGGALRREDAPDRWLARATERRDDERLEAELDEDLTRGRRDALVGRDVVPA